MPKRGENIRKRKDGRWEARYIASYGEDGKAKYKSLYGHSYSEVKQKLKEQLKKPQALACGLNFGEIVTSWLENIKIKLKPASYSTYHSKITCHILPGLGRIKTKNINNSCINGFIKEKAESGLSTKSVNDLVSLLTQILKYGEKNNYIQDLDYDFPKPKSSNKDLQILSVANQSKLLAFLHSNLNKENLGVLLALYTGIRIGELCALTWSDIDFKSGDLKVNKTLQRIKNTNPQEKAKTKIIIGAPKSKKSTREIPLQDFLLDILKSFQGKEQKEQAYILTGQSGCFIEPRAYQRKFKTYLQKAGLEDINFHSLRHTFATRAIEQGFDIKSLSEILGHASVSFTLDRYVHSSSERKKSSMEKLSPSY